MQKNLTKGYKIYYLYFIINNKNHDTMKTLAEHIKTFTSFEMKVARVELEHGSTVRLVVNERTGGSMVIIGKGMTVVCNDPNYHYTDTLKTVDEITSVDQLQ